MNHKEEHIITIKDISQKLNISIASVHRALHGKEGVSDKLKEQILNTADELGYVPNYVAASMKRKKQLIAAVLPADEGHKNVYFDCIWDGVRDCSETLKILNVDLVDYPVQTEDEQYIRLKKIADAGNDEYAGVLTFSYTRQVNVLMQLQRLIAQDIKVVVIDDDLKEPEGLFCIPPNEKTIGEVAAEFVSLVTSGNGTVLVSSGRDDSKVHRNKIESFTKCLNTCSPGLNIEVVHAYSSVYGKDNQLYQKFIKALKQADDVVAIYAITSNDNLPMAEAAEDSGLSDKIKLIGSDINQETVQLLSGGKLHAVIHQGAYTKGYTGLQILADYLVKKVIPETSYFCTIDVVLKANLKFYASPKYIKEKSIGR